MGLFVLPKELDADALDLVDTALANLELYLEEGNPDTGYEYLLHSFVIPMLEEAKVKLTKE